MDPRNVLAAPVGVDDLGHDLVEVHRRRVHHQRPVRSRLDDFPGHQRPGIEAHGAPLDELQAPHGDEVGRAGSGADEIDGHSAASLPVSVASALPAFPA